MCCKQGSMTTNPRSASPGRWCDLQPELINLILHRLSFLDCFSFGGVCSSWRSVLLAGRLCCPARPPPLMVLFLMQETKREEIISNILMRVNGSPPRKLRSPRPTFLPYDRVVGSSSGWLVIASDRKPHSLRLMNPISYQQIPLPSTTSDGTRICLNRSCECGNTCFRAKFVALSSSPTSGNCVLAARGYGSLASFRLDHDQEWTTFRVHHVWGWNEMAFHNGELIVIASGHRILFYNLDPQTNLRATCMAPVTTGLTRLVSSGGELLLVVLSRDPTFPHMVKLLPVAQSRDPMLPPKLELMPVAQPRDPIPPLKLEVYKLGAGGGSWLRLASLGDRVLLLGDLGAESFCTQDLLGTGFEPNCIYYQTSRWKMDGCVAKYSMADGSTETIPLILDDHCHRHQVGFEWIVTQKHAY